MLSLSIFCRGICRFPRFADNAIRKYQVSFLEFLPFILVFSLAHFTFLICFCFLSSLGYQIFTAKGERIL